MPEAINDASGLIDLPANADLLRLLNYWDAKRAGRHYPNRADIDPLDLRFMLDRITLTEVHENPRRYRLRLVGTWWHRILGFESTGMWMEDLTQPNLHRITVEFYQAMIESKQPRFRKRDTILDDRLLQYEILLLPLSEDGENISMIVVGIGPE
ncbi:MAG TPA: PAS domain-containing protein [Dongiaceae bacterium]